MVSEAYAKPAGSGIIERHSRVTQKHWEKILEWNRELPVAPSTCVHEMIEQHVCDQPQNPAIHAWDGNLSYGEMGALSDRLGRLLVNMGCQRETLVLLCFEKSKWAVVAMLAVLKAGAACVFLDPSHPLERKQIIGHEVGAGVLLTSAHACPQEKIATSTLLVNKSFVERIDTCSLPVLPEACPEDAAICLFTSGSTGKPKGIIQEHRTAAFSATNCAQVFRITTGCRVLQWAAYCFDMSVIDMLMTLVAGACLCIPSENDRMDRLAQSIASMRVQVAAMTPSVAKTLKSTHLPDLRTLILGGEAVSREHLEGWPQTLHIINAYGPAEGSVCVAGHASKQSPSNIGKAVGSVLWIVDDSDHTVVAPIGEIGEIYLEGPLLARGYLHDPAKTALAFVEDPPWLVEARGSDHRPHRLYKTGDLARYRENGDVELLGRKDTQIKLRGQRIEVEEVEHWVRQYLLGQFAVAVDIIQPADGPGTARLAAFVAPDETSQLVADKTEELLIIDASSKSALKSRLANLNSSLLESLPAYMIPSYTIPLQHIPLTPSGKVDRKKLRSLGSSLNIKCFADLTHAGISAESPGGNSKEAERLMAHLWEQVLSIAAEEVKPDDNFFMLGGDSINAMQLVNGAKHCNLHLSTKQVFQYPTLSTMSAIAYRNATNNEKAISGPNVAAKSTHHNDTTSGPRAEIESMVQAPDIQAFMVICGLLKSHGYINFFAFDIDGPIDVGMLEYSCRALVERHSSLRSTFRLQYGQLLQVAPSQHGCEVAHVSSREDTQTLLQNLCALEQHCESSLGDLNSQFLVVDREFDQRTLIMRISHAQFDGTSLHLIYRDLKMLYEGARLPRAPQYIDYARAVRQANNSGAESFWRELLHGSAMTHIVRHSKPSYKYVINEKVSCKIAYISVHTCGITQATLVKAAWATVLSCLSHNSDVVFGYAVTGRNLAMEGIGDIVGDCNNAALVRVRLDTVSTVLDLLRQVQVQSVSALPFETVGQRQIVERCTDWPRWTRYSSSINHQNYTMAGANSFRLGKANCTVSYRDLEADRRDIQIYSYPHQDGKMQLEMAFSNEALSASTVKAILKDLGNAIQHMAADVDATLSFPFSSASKDLPEIPMAAAGDRCELKTQRSEVQYKTFNFSILDPRSLVEKVWKRLITCFRESGLLHSEPDVNMPFYDFGGDLVYAAQLSAYYREEGVSFAIEDLIESPTQKMQVELLISERDRSYGSALVVDTRDRSLES